MNNSFTTALIIASFVITLVCSPIAFIWAVNTLFGMKIALTIETWWAGFVLLLILKSSSHTTK